MSDISKDDRDAARAALAPTLQATAEILPLLAKARQPRFPPETAERWQTSCGRLFAAWSDRHGAGLAQLRPAIFELCAIAVELGDVDCLRLSEALASATDYLEDPVRKDDARLLAALSAACECLKEDNGLEHPLFTERARYLAQRLEQSTKPAGSGVRNETLDRIFVGEANERLDAMDEALELLPPDAYAIKTAAEDIAQLAEPLDLYDIIDRARIVIARLTPLPGENIDLDDDATRSELLARIAVLAEAIAEIKVAPPEEPPAGPIVF
ncbi:MAG: hypothetical protein ACM3SV_06040 [Betaproteobacteria bacterium]